MILKRILILISVVLAGEAVFMLPFLMPRLLRPLMLENWHLSNTDIGLAFSAYGVSAAIAYFLGGPIADKYSPRLLLIVSLLSTAALGGFLVYAPSPSLFISIYFLFGITSILLMWDPLIKLTHLIGGEQQRASFMGLMDGLRGAVAALMTSLIYYVLFKTSTFKNINDGELLSIAYLMIIFFLCFISIFLWFSLKGSAEFETKKTAWSREHAFNVLKNKNVWLVGIIVLCAYSGYKSIDNYVLYLTTMHDLSKDRTTELTSYIFWARPFAAILAGFLADKLGQKRHGSRFALMFLLFALGGATQVVLAFANFNHFYYFFILLLLTSVFIYALRAIYFAVLGDIKIPNSIVGTSIGLVSTIGFLPDMFFGSLSGYILDTYSPIDSFKYIFLITGAFLFIGSITCVIIYYSNKNAKDS